MTENIRTIVLDFISNPIIIASWGITSIDVKHDSISFCVDALKYRGKIIINDSKDIVQTLLENNCTTSTKPGIVMQVIDDLIESGPNYNRELKKWVVGNMPPKKGHCD